MRTLSSFVKVAATALVIAFAATGAARAAEENGGPLGCSVWTPISSSTLLGKNWSLRQRDDGQDWTGPWTVVFTSDGNWTSQGSAAGKWCQSGDVVIFSFTSSPHTAYRGTVSAVTVSGYESWDGAGTGTFEMTVEK
jgi:hypothetical protein